MIKEPKHLLTLGFALFYGILYLVIVVNTLRGTGIRQKILFGEGTFKDHVLSSVMLGSLATFITRDFVFTIFNNSVIRMFGIVMFGIGATYVIYHWTSNRIVTQVMGISVEQVKGMICKVLDDNGIAWRNVELPESWRAKIQIGNETTIKIQDRYTDGKQLTISIHRFKSIPNHADVFAQIADLINISPREYTIKQRIADVFIATIGVGFILFLIL